MDHNPHTLSLGDAQLFLLNSMEKEENSNFTVQKPDHHDLSQVVKARTGTKFCYSE